MINLKNKSVVVTGGTKGIGIEIAKSFLKQNAKVFVLARQKPQRTIQAKGNKAVFVECDIRNIDSLLISFKTRISKDEEELDIIFEVSPSDEYNINLYPNAIEDIRGNVNDTLSYKVITQTLEDYGNVYLDVVRNNDSKFILHLIDNNGDIIREYINISQNSTYSFDLIRPGKYSFRLIEDLNENSKWDTGDYLKKIQPEPVYYYKDEIEVRANWDLNETFNLNSILIRKNDSILRN